MLLLRSLAPCCFADGADPSHAPMFIQMLFSPHIEHHQHMGMGNHAMPMNNPLNINSGMDLPTPMGDWSTFFANFFLIALVQTNWLGILFLITQRMARDGTKPLAAHLSVIDPPPRFRISFI
jgi:hypothetical protein